MAARVTGVSVLTLARGRTAHLMNLVEGLRRSVVVPSELVVVDMNDEPLGFERCAFPIRSVRMPDARLPLAAARNLAAREATSERLLFIDADCIADSSLVGVVGDALGELDGLICPEVLYLGPGDARSAWRETDLLAAGRSHPVRPFPKSGYRREPNAGMFWSLAFGVRRRTFQALGGFDESFVGYGGEDTDFGYCAQTAGVPIVLTGDAKAFHQHHAVSDPPFEHLDAIIRNARVFFEKWGFWPMAGWLHAFEAAGYVRFSADRRSLQTSRAPNGRLA